MERERRLAVPVTDRPGDTRLMAGYLDTNSTSITTLTVAGLPSRDLRRLRVCGRRQPRIHSCAASASAAAALPTPSINLTDPANTNFSGTFMPAAGIRRELREVHRPAGGLHADRHAGQQHEPDAACADQRYPDSRPRKMT